MKKFKIFFAILLSLSLLRGRCSPNIDITPGNLHLEYKGSLSEGFLRASPNRQEPVVWTIETATPANCISLLPFPFGWGAKVKAVAKGTAVVKASIKGAEAKVTVTVGPVRARSVELSRNFVELEENGPLSNSKITATVYPEDADNRNVIWLIGGKNPPLTITPNASVVDVIAATKGKAMLKAFAEDNEEVWSEAFISIVEPYDVDADFVYAVPKKTPFSSFASAEFPTGISDSTKATITKRFKISKNEVTYELWKKVYDWATDPFRGNQRYFFRNQGGKGGVGSAEQNLPNSHGSDKQPVTLISFCDAAIWANAYTEWRNTKNSGLTAYVEVYRYAGQVMRHSTNTALCELITPTAGADGFRLPTNAEWEFVARLREDKVNYVPGEFLNLDGVSYFYTKGNSASGVMANDDISTKAVAWYIQNTFSKTSEVAKKNPNYLGVYDMSGNVAEWVYVDDSKSYYRGGHWLSSKEDLQLGKRFSPFGTRDFISSQVGIRIVRND